MPAPLTLTEGSPGLLVRLDEATAMALETSRWLSCTRTADPHVWLVTPGTNVGVVTVGSQQFIIRPKIDISRLVFLMGYAHSPSFWRDDPVQLDPETDFSEALAASFARQAGRALDQGLLKGYRTSDESLTVVRGRIREGDQIRRHWGRLIPIEVRYDDYTADIPENQLLAGAVETLLRLPIAQTFRTPLLRLRVQLADATPVRGPGRPRWTPSRLNARYRTALELAELILDGRSFEQRVGNVTMSGFLFDMAAVFEGFVTVALREAMRPHGGRSSVQYRTHLDVAQTVAIRPDYVWIRDGRPATVADAKYKAEKPSGFPQADMYQMLAYATVLGLDHAHLIYARGNEPEARHWVTNSPLRITAHALDLASTHSQLLASVDRIATYMRAESA